MNELEPMSLDGVQEASEVEVEITEATPLEIAESALAADAERAMTRALAAMKRKTERVVTTIETTLTPRHVAIGASVVLGVGAFLFATSSMRRRPRKGRTVGGAIARSLAREIVSRMLLGAAATIGARLAEAAVPMLVASISARQERRSRPSRPRKTKPPIDPGPGERR